MNIEELQEKNNLTNIVECIEINLKLDLNNLQELREFINFLFYLLEKKYRYIVYNTDFFIEFQVEYLADLYSVIDAIINQVYSRNKDKGVTLTYFMIQLF